MLRKILNHFGYYKIEQLSVGGHCGCCGEPMIQGIFTDKSWSWGICDKCKIL